MPSVNIKRYIESLDLTKTPEKLGVHFEQKITPDLLWCVAATIIGLTGRNINFEFGDKEIRTSPYFISLMRDYFTKPTQNSNTENEYNKVSKYQCGLLEYVGVLRRTANRPRKLKIKNLQALEFISNHDRSALEFLKYYVEKLLIDNGLMAIFKKYKKDPSQQNYESVKDKYWQWAKEHTGVRTNNPQHSYRVVNKIFNLYAYSHRIPGESSARVTSGICPYTNLVYNRVNFRDVNMPTGISRREFTESIELDESDPNIFRSLVMRSKQDVRQRHRKSEIAVKEYNYHDDEGIHAHRVLPESQYNQFAFFKENIICLTPGQHLSLAHVRGNTHRVDSGFQKICLKYKLKSIEDSMLLEDNFYNLENFITLINIFPSINLPLDSDLETVRRTLNNL